MGHTISWTAICLLSIAGCGAQADTAGSITPAAWPTSKYISPQEVHQRLTDADTDLLLVNVVDEEYYDLGHIAGSLVIPWDLLPGRVSEVDAQRHVVLYCRRGVRSEAAYETLDSSGFADLWVMEGGLVAWLALGYTTLR